METGVEGVDKVICPHEHNYYYGRPGWLTADSIRDAYAYQSYYNNRFPRKRGE